MTPKAKAATRGAKLTVAKVARDSATKKAAAAVGADVAVDAAVATALVSPAKAGVNGEAELSGGRVRTMKATPEPESAEPSAQQDRAPARSAHREPRRSEPAAEAAAVREAVVEPAGHQPAAERPAAKSTEEAPRPRRARSSDASATVEPKLERVVVTPDQTVGAESDGSSEPARRGWWQRRLGGG